MVSTPTKPTVSTPTRYTVSAPIKSTPTIRTNTTRGGSKRKLSRRRVSRRKRAYTYKRGGHYEFERVLAPYGVRTGAETVLRNADAGTYNMIENKVNQIKNLPDTHKTALVQPINKLVTAAAPIAWDNTEWQGTYDRRVALSAEKDALQNQINDIYKRHMALQPSANAASNSFMRYYNDNF